MHLIATKLSNRAVTAFLVMCIVMVSMHTPEHTCVLVCGVCGNFDSLQSLSGETLTYSTVIAEDGTHLDVSADGWPTPEGFLMVRFSTFLSYRTTP